MFMCDGTRSSSSPPSGRYIPPLRSRTFRLVAIRFQELEFLFQMLIDLIGERNGYFRSRHLYQMN
jgi:hypothetical protein